MTDENEEHEHHHHIFGFPIQFGPPPEVVEQMRMNHEANAHETRQFFDSLTEDQLKKLSGLIGQVVHTDGHAGSYYQGVITVFLDQKFGSCMACSKKHDEELAAMSGQPAPEHSQTEAGDRALLMEQYNMEADDDGSEKVMCKGCGQWYMNLEDRMLRKPGIEGCPGCVQKQKWG